MKIIKIRNSKIMKNARNPNGYHFYALFWNRKFKRYNAIRLTHISRKDISRYRQVESGKIKPIRIKKLDKYADSGVTKHNYISDVHGNKLFPGIGIIVDNKVSSSISRKILSHVNSSSKYNLVNKKRKSKKNKK